LAAFSACSASWNGLLSSMPRRTITESMEEDPALYMQFSEMLEETIRDYRERRLSEKDYLAGVIDIASRVATKDHGRELPARIKGNQDAAAFFGILEPALTASRNGNGDRDEAADIALAVIDIIKAHHIVDVWSNDVAQNKMRNAIDDYFFDVLRDQKGIELPVDRLDELESRIMNVARARFPA
jgi:type I restriction enzyme, R subunit